MVSLEYFAKKRVVFEDIIFLMTFCGSCAYISAGLQSHCPLVQLPFVCHESLFLLARTVAVTVEPLLPPHPTIMRPTLGTLLSVRNVIGVLRGEACIHEVLGLLVSSRHV